MADLWSLGGGRNSVPLRGSVLPKNTVGFVEKEVEAVKKVSYAEKVREAEHPFIEYSQLPEPGFRGDYPTITLPKAAYERGLEYCKFSLIARLDLQEVPLSDLKDKATLLWKLAAPFTITPLGKGFLHLKFENGEDYQRVWTGGPWKFGNELLRLQKWERNFRPESQKRTNALVWIRLPNLPMECWDVVSLLSIGRSVGYPMKVDDTSLSKQFGYYANVLVDVDLSKPIPDQVLVSTGDYEFWQDIVVTRLPKFCNHCKTVGHSVTECRKLQGAMEKGKDIVIDLIPKEGFQEVKRSRNRRRKSKKAVNSAPSMTWVAGKTTTPISVSENKFHHLQDESESSDEEPENRTNVENQLGVADSAKQPVAIELDRNPLETKQVEEEKIIVEENNQQVEDESALEVLDGKGQISFDNDETIHFQLAELDDTLITNIYGVNFGSFNVEYLSESLPNSEWVGRLVDDPDWGTMMQIMGDVRKEAAVVFHDVGIASLEHIKIHRPSKSLKTKFKLAHWGNSSVVI